VIPFSIPTKMPAEQALTILVTVAAAAAARGGGCGGGGGGCGGGGGGRQADLDLPKARRNAEHEKVTGCTNMDRQRTASLTPPTPLTPDSLSQGLSDTSIVGYQPQPPPLPTSHHKGVTIRVMAVAAAASLSLRPGGGGRSGG
jgi:hypothetical protein